MHDALTCSWFRPACAAAAPCRPCAADLNDALLIAVGDAVRRDARRRLDARRAFALAVCDHESPNLDALRRLDTPILHGGAGAHAGLLALVTLDPAAAADARARRTAQTEARDDG